MDLKERLEALEAEAAKVAEVDAKNWQAWQEAKIKIQPLQEAWSQSYRTLQAIENRIEILKQMISEGGQP